MDYGDDPERALANDVEENMNFDSDAYDRAVREEGLVGSSSRNSDAMLADAENMNFDIDELEQTLRDEGVGGSKGDQQRPARPPPPPAEPAPERSRSFFGRLKQTINPAPTTDPVPDPLPTTPPGGSSGAVPPSGGEGSWASARRGGRPRPIWRPGC